jgi:hypothetical protein
MSNHPDESWTKLLARMKQSAIEECGGQGVSVMSMKIIMRGGQPVGWSIPHVEHYQAPVRADLLSLLAGDLT